MTWRIALCGVVGLVLLPGCGSDSFNTPPADFSGTYSVAVTNGANGCNFQNWTVGENAANTPVTITQDGSNVTADVGGVPAIYYGLILGGHVFQGTVSGHSMSMSIHGTPSFKQGNCTYTVIATLTGKLDGNSISGNIDYSAATNGGADCGALDKCASTQSFAGSRPPK